ncbi:uncharacterized protein SPPG_03439 [Spizellomyces punctatus DAOM BR117]|uniref:Acyltransferase 3 domain-containing protein n=1 Tax=Spizellomyces punctatus (strain DAOM BR117) TaxID=645134 RepID=A0A0L0HKT6_SPIPD|nr:uncharacterized protein SPPG_03439 [Spizellomyces punctatus DAOM BR117]KND01643.1 hypothetical protein SPPG_03439 [Spizellomyces punctatus DAOM BR117]|eukprot:XP_016609682.1 hypothetical protein SPPG_03439 [Spizellomyces punctatus DAOM BR117]
MAVDEKLPTILDVPIADTAAKDAKAADEIKPVKEVRKSIPFFSVKCLTGLRGVAAMGVVASHLFSGDGAKVYVGGWEGLNEMGNIAVIFFFVLSAFLLTVRPLTERQKPSDAKYVKWSENGILIPWISVRWIKYLIRRVFRILPLYWIILLIIAAVPQLHTAYADLRNFTPFSWSTAISYAFFRDVNSIFWTIPPEFEYYLVMPFFIVLFEMAERKDKLGEWIMGIKPNPPNYPYGLGCAEIQMKEHYRKGLHNRVLHVYYRFGRRLLLLLVLSLFNCFVAPLFWSAHGAYDYYHLPPFVKRFWLGSLAAFIYHMFAQYGYVIYDFKGPNINQKWSKKATKWISVGGDLICWALLITLFLSFPWYRRKILNMYVPREPISWYADHMHDWPVLGSALICFLVSFATRNGSFAHFFEWSVFMFAGDISFPLYLTHPPVIHLAQDRHAQGIDGVLFVFLFCFFIASCFHFLVEKPVGKLGQKLARWVQQKYFSKDPKLAVDVEKHEEMQVKKYTDMGLTMNRESPDSESRPSSALAGNLATYSVVKGNGLHKKSGPLVQIIQVKEDKPEEKTGETPASTPRPEPNLELRQDEQHTRSHVDHEEDEAPLAALAASKTYSRYDEVVPPQYPVNHSGNVPSPPRSPQPPYHHRSAYSPSPVAQAYSDYRYMDQQEAPMDVRTNGNAGLPQTWFRNQQQRSVSLYANRY